MTIASLIASTTLFLSSSLVHADLIPHDPIYIESNDNFIPANGVISGSGTENDPYVIENWNIDASSAHGIEIRNTNACFVIRNCYVHDGWVNFKCGIHLHNVKNGTVDNNLMENNYNGKYLASSVNNLLSNNLMKNNEFGIFLYSDSDNNLVSNNLVVNNWTGISLFASENNLVTNNLVKNNTNGIIPFDNSDNNLVINNIVENNEYGISLLYASNNNLVKNNLVKNNKYGILVVASDNNRVYHNDFVKNENQAFDGGSNYWDNGSEGNYWSDYTGEDINNDGIGDTPYTIPGDNNQDRYPLMSPFVEKQPSEPVRWPLIAGIVGVIAIIGIAFVFKKRR